jgi:hypothetical protein
MEAKLISNANKQQNCISGIDGRQFSPFVEYNFHMYRTPVPCVYFSTDLLYLDNLVKAAKNTLCVLAGILKPKANLK